MLAHAQYNGAKLRMFRLLENQLYWTRIDLAKMREIARIVSFNGVKLDTMGDFSALTSMPARLSDKMCGIFPILRGGGADSPCQLLVSRGEKIYLVQECVVVLLGGGGGGWKKWPPATRFNIWHRCTTCTDKKCMDYITYL